MYYSTYILDAIRQTIENLEKGSYEAAGGTLFFLYENIEDEVTEPPLVRKQAVALVEEASTIVLGDDPEDFGPVLKIYSVGEDQIIRAITCLKTLLALLEHH